VTTKKGIDWNNVEAVAKQLAGNWYKLECFAWSRGYDLDDADQWCIWYTSSRDAGLLEQSNEKAIRERLQPFSDGDDPDLVFESHSHWACGHIDGFSIRVFKPDGSITPAFEEFCKIKQDLENYPVLNESDYSDREYEATLENYRSEMWGCRDELPEGWEAEVYSWFSDNGHDEFIENTDDRGGWASREKIIEALQSLALMPSVVVAVQPSVQR
jgi:hypothetical protein